MSQFCVFENYATVRKSYPIKTFNLDFLNVIFFCLFLTSLSVIIISASRNLFLNDK